MRIFLITILSMMLSINCLAADQCVILLHGLGKSHRSMEPLATYLRSNHYFVVNEDYPTTKNSIETLASQYISPMIKACLETQPQKIHFVTHSLGGLVLREYLQNHKVPKLSRIVMLGPPNH